MILAEGPALLLFFSPPTGSDFLDLAGKERALLFLSLLSRHRHQVQLSVLADLEVLREMGPL